jgi:hypothetical protein
MVFIRAQEEVIGKDLYIFIFIYLYIYISFFPQLCVLESLMDFYFFSFFSKFFEFALEKAQFFSVQMGPY